MSILLDNLPEILFERSDGAVCYRGTGVKFHIFVNAYNLGHSPEVLVSMFGTLEMDDVSRLIGCYLENRELADEFVAECNLGWDDAELRKTEAWQATPAFRSRRKAHIEKKKRDGMPPYDSAERGAADANALQLR